MSMTLEDLKRLDPKDIANWPAAIQLVCLSILTVLVVVAGYFLLRRHL